MTRTPGKSSVEELQSAYERSYADLAAAAEECETLAERSQEQERDLQMKRRWLRAWLGEDRADQRIREKLMDSVEFQSLDPSKLQKEITSGMKAQTELRTQIREAAARKERAAAVEQSAFYALYRAKHKDSVVAVLQAEVAFARALREERKIRDTEAGRTGRTVGELPIFAHGHGQHFALNDSCSMTAYRIREAIASGYLAGNEDWLTGVCFKTGANA